MSTLAERIKQGREEIGLNKSQFARAVGVSAPTVTDWESGTIASIKVENVFKMSRVIHRPVDWIMSGKENRTGEERAVYEVPDITEDPRKQGKVPVISWVKAGQADLAIDNLAPGDAIDWKWCNEPHSDSTFALIVDGDSMTAPYGKSYPHKATIFVDPEKRGSVETGEAIIAKISGVDKVTFKSLARDDGRVFLKPLNPQYPNMFEEFRVLGKVIGKWED